MIPGVGDQLNPIAENLPIELLPQVIELNLPNEFHRGVQASVYRSFDISNTRFRWFGSTGPGIICLDDIYRDEGFMDPNPHISQISQLLYERDFPLESLRYVFVTTVIESETREFILNELDWAGFHQRWPIGTPEYDALLGTRIGKVVAYLVLGAFERGTRRITRINLWPDTAGGLNMRFDIEPTS